jgi:nitrite reductase (NADH) small subunit
MSAVANMVRVASLADLSSDKPLGVTVNGQKIALFQVDGEVLATTGVCPHARGPIDCGTVADKAVTCPWHGWSFDLHSGQCLEDPDLKLATYPVQVEGDDILVAL